jgi:hypothetical protein
LNLLCCIEIGDNMPVEITPEGRKWLGGAPVGSPSQAQPPRRPDWQTAVLRRQLTGYSPGRWGDLKHLLEEMRAWRERRAVPGMKPRPEPERIPPQFAAGF